MVMVKVGGAFHGWSLYIGHVLDFDTRLKERKTHSVEMIDGQDYFDTFLGCSIFLHSFTMIDCTRDHFFLGIVVSALTIL